MTDSQPRQSGLAGLVGRLHITEGKGTVHIEGRLDSSISDVWSALAGPEPLARWLGHFEGELKPGGDFRARFFSSEWEGTGRVEICSPPRRLLVSLTEADSKDTHFMEITLNVQGQQTDIVVEERGIPREQLAAYGAGVQVHVEDLVTHLSGGERCDAQARWKALFPSYSAMSIEPT